MAKRGRKVSPAALKKSKAILVKMSESEYKILFKYSLSKGIGVSTYLRESVLKNISTKNLKK